MAACGTLDPDQWITSLIRATECQASLLGTAGWQGLTASPMFSYALTGVLTIAIARLGYRLMMRNAVPAEVLRIILHVGLVIALATSWQAYDRLIYRVAMDGPAEIGNAIFPAAQIDTSNLARRLQNAYSAIVTPPDPDPDPNLAQGGLAQSEPGGAANPELLASGADPMAQRRTAADVMIIAGVGTWMAVRLALAVLLALGPIAIAASLFPISAGLLAGWARALIGAVLAALFIPLAISLELQLLEGPVRAAVRANEPEVPGLTAIVWSFVIVIAGLVFMAQKFSGALGLRIAQMPAALEAWIYQRAAPVAQAPAPAELVPPSRNGSAARAASAEQIAPPRLASIVQALEMRRQQTSPPSVIGSTTSNVVALPVPRSSSARRSAQIADGASRAGADRTRRAEQRLGASS